MIQVERERWIIVCKKYKVDYKNEYKDGYRLYNIDILDEKELNIFCGLARHYELQPISKIGNKAIKTYLSKNKAESAFISSWNCGEELINAGIAKAVKVKENIIEIQEETNADT
jgi:hypothetical protein